VRRSLGIVASWVVSCAPTTGYRPPASPRAYQILITRQDSLSRAIGKRLTRRGFTVRKEGKRGASPTAYLFSFTRREAEPGSPLWLYVRLTDTRTGALVAAVSAPLDSLGSTTDVRAQAIVDSLTRVAVGSGGRSPP